MSRIIIITILTLLPSLYTVFADNNLDNDLTSSGFTITVQNLNPMISNSDSDPTNTPGIDALNHILNKLSTFLLWAIPIIAGISFAIAGYYYIFSSGDTEKASKAKTIIKWNILAILISYGSYAIISLLLFILRLDS